MQLPRAPAGPSTGAQREAPRVVDSRRSASRGRPSDASLELGLASVERVAERRVPGTRRRGSRGARPHPRRLRVLAREIAALDECDGVREIRERQPACETRAVGTLGRVGAARSLAAPPRSLPPRPSSSVTRETRS